MKEFVEKLIERLEVEKNSAINVYTKYEINLDLGRVFGLEKSIEIVNQLAEEYMTCYKSCTECEAYDKENHHCPKFCYIIAETVKEIEENHNGWIPLAERMPEDGVNVLVWFEYFRYGNYNRLFQTVGISYTYDGDWSGFVNGSSGWSQLRILAWKPLPSPYKPEEKKRKPETNFYSERFNRVM